MKSEPAVNKTLFNTAIFKGVNNPAPTCSSQRSKFVSLDRLYHFKVFKGCLPQILLGLFLDTLTHLGMSGLIVVFGFKML